MLIRFLIRNSIRLNCSFINNVQHCQKASFINQRYKMAQPRSRSKSSKGHSSSDKKSSDKKSSDKKSSDKSAVKSSKPHLTESYPPPRSKTKSDKKVSKSMKSGSSSTKSSSPSKGSSSSSKHSSSSSKSSKSSSKSNSSSPSKSSGHSSSKSSNKSSGHSSGRSSSHSSSKGSSKSSGKSSSSSKSSTPKEGSSSKKSDPRVCLIVIDGWGLREEKHGNAILNAETPVMDALSKRPGQATTLDASSLAVGLPEGQMGNSEVGHLNIGAGRALLTDIDRIDKDIADDKLVSNPQLVEAVELAKTKSDGRIHLLGLVSDGGVHAHIKHLFALMAALKRLGVPNTYIHFFSDGRDTAPESGKGFVEQVVNKINELSYGKLSTLMGRYYAMDRDKRWERIKIAYDGLVQGKGEETTLEELPNVIQGRYDRAEKMTDEFMTPIIINKEGLIKDNDTMIFIDYRADRMREITTAFGIKQEFESEVIPKNLNIFTMTEYNKEFPFKILFPKIIPKNVLAEAISNAGKLQFHCGETEKYAHVTFFFNGGQDDPFKGEDRKLCPSPKVATYDLKPEMSADDVAQSMADAIATKKYDFLMCNFANPDMVGHTGKYEPAVIACAVTDKGIGKILEACNANGYTLLVTADHGNAEKMYDDNDKPFTAHTTYRVPFYMTGDRKFGDIAKITPNAALRDVAPTVLDLMNIPVPAEMEGKSLLAPK